jgi:hypothetical protein
MGGSFTFSAYRLWLLSLQLQFWGDLSIPWNMAQLKNKDALVACGYGGGILNNVMLPNHLDKITPWGVPFPQGKGPQGALP